MISLRELILTSVIVSPIVSPLVSEIYIPYRQTMLTSFSILQEITKNILYNGQMLSVSPFIDGVKAINLIPFSNSTQPLFINIVANDTQYKWYIASGFRKGTLMDDIKSTGSCTIFPCYLTINNNNGIVNYVASNTASGVLLAATSKIYLTLTSIDNVILINHLGCGDSFCDITAESCLTCPYDCSCNEIDVLHVFI